MDSITLHILAEDIKTTNYSHSKDCAITRALHRAGFNNLRDNGVRIVNKSSLTVIDGYNHDVLGDRIIQMYNRLLPIEDFTFILTKEGNEIWDL